jgi:hypothetical protein
VERFIVSINKSLQTENWYAALSMALTAPDICGWLKNPNTGSQKRYESWFDQYLLSKYKSPFHGSDFTLLTGSDCYALRCAYLHEGTDDVQRQRASDAVTRFAFTTAGSHKCKFDSVLLLDVRAFCTDVCAGVQSWIDDFKSDKEVQGRIKELLLVRTQEFQIIPGVLIQ